MNCNRARTIKRKELEETKNEKKNRKETKTTQSILMWFGTKVPTSTVENCPTDLKLY